MNRFINFFIVLLLLAASIVFLTWTGKPSWHALASVICAVACGWYATKTNFGRL